MASSTALMLMKSWSETGTHFGWDDPFLWEKASSALQPQAAASLHCLFTSQQLAIVPPSLHLEGCMRA